MTSVIGPPVSRRRLPPSLPTHYFPYIYIYISLGEYGACLPPYFNPLLFPLNLSPVSHFLLYSLPLPLFLTAATPPLPLPYYKVKHKQDNHGY